MSTQRFLCAWIGALGLAAGAFGQTYVQISVNSSTVTIPTGINASGEIAGFYAGSSGQRHGFVRDPSGRITTFNVPGSSGTLTFGINKSGAIAGYYVDPSGALPGYVRDPEGNFATFNPPGSIQTWPLSINAGGAVTGYYYESISVSHGFLRQANGELIVFDPAGCCINASGVIAGTYFDANGRRYGFVRHPDGTIESFDVPGSDDAFVTAINDAGAVTGQFGNFNTGFVRDPQGNFTTFFAGRETFPSSINNKGAIAGLYQPSNGAQLSGFVRSPDGTITSFVPPFCAQHGIPASSVFINDSGVITGYCTDDASRHLVGWVRYP
jgi:hypothetical protein